MSCEQPQLNILNLVSYQVTSNYDSKKFTLSCPVHEQFLKLSFSSSFRKSWHFIHFFNKYLHQYFLFSRYSSRDSVANKILSVLKFYQTFFLFEILFIIFRQRGKEGENERNISVWLALTGPWPATQACALTGNRNSDPLVYRLALNPLSHTRQGYQTFIILQL